MNTHTHRVAVLQRVRKWTPSFHQVGLARDRHICLIRDIYFVQDNSRSLICAADTIPTLFTDTNKHESHTAERNRLAGRLQVVWLLGLCILCSRVSLWRMMGAWKERESHRSPHSNIHLPESERQHTSLDLCPGHGRSALGSPAHCNQKGSKYKPGLSVEGHLRGRVA